MSIGRRGFVSSLLPISVLLRGNMRDQGSINIKNFKGLYSRGKDDSCPEDHFSDGQNFDFDEEDVVTRDGMGVKLSSGVAGFGLAQAFSILIGNAQKFITLDSSGVLSHWSGSTRTDLVTFSAPNGVVNSFDYVRLYNRYYITPLLNGNSIRGEFVYVVTIGKVTGYTIPIGGGGTGYTVGDILTLVPTANGDNNAKVRILTVGGAGDISSAVIIASGTNYAVEAGCATIGGTGTGALISITAVTHTCTKAAGLPPSGFTITAAVGAAGKCDAGRRLIAVAYETDTGFITAPGPVSWSLFNLSPGARKINLSNLPVNGEVVTVAVAAGGAGYAVGNVLTLSGTDGVVCTVTVATVAAGVVLTVTLTTDGSGYTTGVKATTGGAGAGCTINVLTLVTLPSNVIARHILVSKVVFNYNVKNFNQLEHELFFIAGGKIEDVLTDTLILDYYDSELLSSADYLIDQLSEIPSGTCLEVYNERLCVGGEALNPHTVRASNVGTPESMNSTNGFKTVAPDDSSGQTFLGVGVKNLKSLRGALYIWKPSKTYATQDNGNSASSWSVTLIDASIGCESRGVGVVLDNTGASADFLLVANTSGLKLFNGTYTERDLTYKIKNIWRDGIVQGYSLIYSFVVIDALNKRILVNFPDSTSNGYPTIILVGDYEGGLDWQSIQWSIWKTPKKPLCIFLGTNLMPADRLYFTDGNQSSIGIRIFQFASSYTGDYTTTPNDTAIDSYVETALLTFDETGGLNLFSALRLRIMGSGSLAITLTGEDNANPVTPTSSPITLAATPGKELRPLINYIAERMSVKLRTNAIGAAFRLIRMSIFGQPIYEERPQ